MVNLLEQVLAVTGMNLRNVPLRLGNSLVIAIGIAGAVGVFIPIVAMSLSFRATIEGDGHDSRAIVLTQRATTESDSSLTRDEVSTLADYPQVGRDLRGRPLASGEVVLVAPVSRKRDHSDVNVTVRGVGEQYFAMRPELKLRSGRMFETGKQELLVGAGAAAQFDGLNVGENLRLQDGDWKVVGIFSGGNGARESEVVADALTVMSAYKLNAFNSLSVTLRSPRDLAAFKDAVGSSSKSLLVARGEPEYLAIASEQVNRVLRLVGYVIGSIMALGALFSALNSMYSAVSSRSVEMATLRALGFSSAAVAAGVLLEALLLALVGAGAGAAFAYLLFDGATISTLGGAVWDSQLVYSLTISPALVIQVVLLACALGLLGGLLPAVRAARANIADVLHES
jgi:putative ABC transport system permease protein